MAYLMFLLRSTTSLNLQKLLLLADLVCGALDALHRFHGVSARSLYAKSGFHYGVGRIQALNSMVHPF